MGLKHNLSPNKAQTRFISGKHIPILGQPIKETERHSRTKCLQSFSKGVQTHIPHVILQYANSDEIGDVADIRYAVRRQLFLEVN